MQETIEFQGKIIACHMRDLQSEIKTHQSLLFVATLSSCRLWKP